MSPDESVKASTWSQLAPLSGAVFVLAWLIGSLLMTTFDFMPPSGEIVSFYEDDSTRISIGGYVSTLSVFFLIWFSSSLKDHLQKAEGGGGRLANVAFGGGIAAAALILIASAMTVMAAQRADSDTGIGPEYATLVHDMFGALTGSGLPIAIAALIYATAIVSFRTGAFPKWLAWVSGVLGIALLTPYNWAVLVLMVPWFLIVSVIMYRNGRRESSGLDQAEQALA